MAARHPLDESAQHAVRVDAQVRSAELDRRRYAAMAVERERRRWALELHDETLQGLGALRALLSAAQAHGGEDQLRATMRSATDLLNDEIGRLRRLIVDLRPSELDELGLAAALEHLLGRFRGTDPFLITTDVHRLAAEEDDGLRLVPEIETAIFRVVQEGLTNIRKHARASHVHVSVRERDGAMEVVVADDGAGFEPGGVQGRHFGLLGMHERAELVSGSLDVSSSPAGTTVRLVVPAIRDREPVGASSGR